jgi:ATP-dependent DNA helicase RecG
VTEPTSPSPTDPLQQGIATLKMTPTRRDQLARLGLATVGDVLFHFPRFYEDLTKVTPIAELVAGETVTVQGEVVEIEGRQLDDGRRVLGIVLSDDGKHVIEGVWFNQAGAARGLRYGQRLAFSGKPKWYRDHWQMTHPRLQRLDGSEESPELTVVPVYPLTEDLSVERLREVIRQAVDRCAGFVPDVLPPALREQHGFPEVRQALENVHFPKSLKEALTARRRFVYEEFLVLQVALACRRREVRDRQRAPVLTCTPQVDARIRKLFPFALTDDQNRAVADVVRNLASDRPMQRLLQADVGAGKTAVAVYALLVTVANKHQAVLMAPTEVLARQHHHTLERYLAQSRVRRLLLTGGMTAKQRREALALVKAGEVDLVVGTQALLQEDVEFAKLGLVVIDEQHKFGVNQRAQVRRLGVDPHYLVMTATPIPRTMALTVFGDLDVSVIKQLPPGRRRSTGAWTRTRRIASWGSFATASWMYW